MVSGCVSGEVLDFGVFRVFRVWGYFAAIQ